jgi:hypothetical protein
MSEACVYFPTHRSMSALGPPPHVGAHKRNRGCRRRSSGSGFGGRTPRDRGRQAGHRCFAILAVDGVPQRRPVDDATARLLRRFLALVYLVAPPSRCLTGLVG